MFLKTILYGKLIAGIIKKNIQHPYSGVSADLLEYAKDINIVPHEDTKDINALRRELISAAYMIKTYLKKNENFFLKTVSNETGSPISYHGEDLGASYVFLDKINNMENILSKKFIFEPKGNILLILSANEPIILTIVLAFSSLFMGNTVFIKPSSKTASFGYFLIKKLAKIRAFRRRMHYLLIDQKETERLIKAKVFDFVLSFASRITNAKLSLICADSEVEFLQESEGNDWAYIDRNCEPYEKLSALITKSFTRHNGQMCNAVRGILVHQSAYEKIVELLKKNVLKIRVGAPYLDHIEIGALLAGTSKKTELFIKKNSQKAETVWNFSTNNNVVTPTLIINPDNRSDIFSEGMFAPVLWIKKVKNYLEAIALYDKKNKHGLGFSVFSKNKKVIDEFINKIKTGRININKEPLKTGLFAPLGGIKLSGHGGPSYWIEKVSNRKYINQ